MNVDHKTDCRHYKGDRPCLWNKKEQAECPSCTHYDQVKHQVLIIKLDAMGDVLRSTVILPKLKEKHPESKITWLTRKASAPLMAGNPYIDDIWILDEPESTALRTARDWDIVINLDNSPVSSSLASTTKANTYIGFTQSRSGVITPTNQAAATWLTMACFDRLKKSNTLSYQEHMYSICGFVPPIEKPVLLVPEAKKKWAYSLLNKSGAADHVLIGINTGAGGRWPLKMMSEKALTGVIQLLINKTDWHLVLLGGPAEQERNDRLTASLDSPRIIHVGCDHAAGDFAALVGQCNAMLCGDTLALHIATALSIPTVALFCPTSIAEIYDYNGMIKKIQPQKCDCICGYNRDCPTQKDCINDLSPELLLNALRDQLARGG